MIQTKLISKQQEAEWQLARQIREDVFVVEQKVPLEEEYDDFDATARHFLAFDQEQAVGTCRWRVTEKGVKLERFAVLADARGKGVGSALVQATLTDIAQSEEAKDKVYYLHAQLDAMPLYAKHGFEPEGEHFQECDIWHCKMTKKP